LLFGRVVDSADRFAPFLGEIFEDTSGRGDIRLAVSLSALLVSEAMILSAGGVVAGMIPALIRAARA
jgi:hypothetical protein